MCIDTCICILHCKKKPTSHDHCNTLATHLQRTCNTPATHLQHTMYTSLQEEANKDETAGERERERERERESRRARLRDRGVEGEETEGCM